MYKGAHAFCCGNGTRGLLLTHPRASLVMRSCPSSVWVNTSGLPGDHQKSKKA
jgi:hypothetical protein